MNVNDSTLEDIRMWFEEGMLIAKFIEGEGLLQEAKDWRSMLNDFLSAYKLAICGECGCCFEPSEWEDGNCRRCTQRINEYWQEHEEARREAIEHVTGIKRR